MTTVIADELLASFVRDGAVLVPGVLSEAWIELLSDGLDECIAAPDDLSSSLSDGTAEIRIDQFPAARSERLRRFVLESPLGALVGAFVGGPVRFYMDQMFAKPAGAQMATAWHQDTPYYNVGGAALVRAWVSPDPVPREASLEVVRGSHLWNVTYRPLGGRDPGAEPRRRSSSGVEEQRGATFSYGDAITDRSLPRVPDIAGNRESFDIVGWDYQPGDVILFRGHMLHGARGDHVLQRGRRAHAAMYAGSDVHYVERPGQVIPDPVGLAAHAPASGQTLDEFDDVFPLVWDGA